VILFEIVVVVPWLAGAVPDLHEADATFDEAAGDEHLAALQGVAIHVANVLGFKADIEGIGRFELHAVGEFEAFETGFEVGIVFAGLGVFFVELAEEVELLALTVAGKVFGCDVFDELARVGRFGVDIGALISGGEKAGLPVLGAGDGVASGAH